MGGYQLIVGSSGADGGLTVRQMTVETLDARTGTSTGNVSVPLVIRPSQITSQVVN